MEVLYKSLHQTVLLLFAAVTAVCSLLLFVIRKAALTATIVYKAVCSSALVQLRSLCDGKHEKRHYRP